MKIKTNIGNLKNYKIYLKVEQAVHEFMRKKEYLKIDLPVLSPALIPESYLEIFETEFRYFDKKEKLYLTPSPELFLKRLLSQGIGDCYYLGKAFRNSEPNSDLHFPEYTMLEYYRKGFTYLQLADEILELMRFITQRLYKRDNIIYQGKKVFFSRWEKFTVAEAFEKFSGISKKELSDKSLLLKHAQEKGYKVKGFSYQDIFSQIITQEIEPKLGKNGYPTLLYDYPKEMSSLAKLTDDGKIAKRAEFYIYGIEIGGCCEELNNWQEQKKRFIEQLEKRNHYHMINHSIDKGFIEAVKYGLPDCTGVGIGFDRLSMIFANTISVQEMKLVTVG